MMDAPESASAASAVMPTVAPLLAFSAFEFAFASLSERVGLLLIEIEDVASAELLDPSLTTHEMVRVDELGFWDVLL